MLPIDRSQQRGGLRKIAWKIGEAWVADKKLYADVKLQQPRSTKN